MNLPLMESLWSVMSLKEIPPCGWLPLIKSSMHLGLNFLNEIFLSLKKKKKNPFVV